MERRERRVVAPGRVHLLRRLRAVIPEIDEVYDADAAKDHLGHTSKTVTERHYINRRLVVPDYRAATERLAPGSGASKGPAPGH